MDLWKYLSSSVCLAVRARVCLCVCVCVLACMQECIYNCGRTHTRVCVCVIYVVFLVRWSECVDL